MKKSKSNLDEMQEQKLLRIEHTGFWICFTGLALVIYAQLAIGHSDPRSLGGETLVLLISAAYLVISCIRNGIWDRKLKPDLKTNLCISLAAGGAVGIFWFLVSYRNYHSLAGSLATLVFMAAFTFALTLVLLLATAAVYNRRKRQLDSQADREEDGE